VKSAQIRPLITVITAVLNCSATIEKTIRSVLNQSFESVEYIIIDGGSTDGTLDIIRHYEHEIDYWVSEPDKGIYDAWNKGITLASGQWIAFLGADDTFLDGALDAYANAIAVSSDTQLEYISSRVNLVEGHKVMRVFGQKWNWTIFQRYMNVAHVGSLHSRALFEKYGLYDTTYKICGDYEFLLRSRAKLKVAFVNLTTVNMSIGGASDNFLALCEAERAKVYTAGRNSSLSRMEKILAILKLKLRRALWY
jgi:glycosyltransferase involved in cell wall biosynthesis